MKTLKTSYEIRKAFGEDYACLKRNYDIRTRERRATEKVRKQLEPKKCAGCGRMQSTHFRLEAAHITPLAECSKTDPSNLLFLCMKRKRSKQKHCHTLFDEGYCSIQDMMKCQLDWLANRPAKLRSKMESFLKKYGQHPQLLGHLGQKLKDLHKKQAAFSPMSNDWHALQVQIAEVTRRRARKEALKEAWEEIVKVNTKFLETPALLSRYYYEKAYIELLSGQLDDAFDDFYSGRKLLTKNLRLAGNRWRWAAHTSLLAQVSCIMRTSDSKQPQWSWDSIRNELTKALRYSKTATREALRLKPEEKSQEEFRHSSRWVQNCLVHIVMPDIAQGKLIAARKRWKAAYANWMKMDVSSGWDAGFRPTHLWLYGKLLFEEGKNDEAIAHLVRALVLLLGLRR